ncbi:hypothetical protein BX616_008958 [Lobosporangium transversale]|uniref:DNA mismatch repair protein MutL n=1 Tax=Lobosporangium transversale TaxID=64571 RepID=A0A1Y2GTR8_9FUNG|nr:hypothetical protein BCR41DRAFT_420638 [Lobosporangium transversale]KAF9918398.1 hypothetical protein BX616_008958 [Lobosporangium transversale]ORZ22890.1 hypothetical protein BCR41DRAFT_420638 [Lobosporangium transversale]|eukprot:XP_021883444.1 hypothetical protein BCR41DRAFT_420638 [Lobosporangium transversale]
MASQTNNTIRAIDKESVHRICSGQVVLDMATAVKELLENSLDAGSTSVAIKFKQNGLESITVTDNGCGITDANLETLALKHYTSKLQSFNDLAHVRSFGFRGEALSSLCALANLTVTTSTGSSPTGVLVEYTSDGTIKSKTPTPMTRGTIVKISNLFEGMPVRRSEFVKNIKREYAKCIGLVQAYALIVPNVRISCVLQMDKMSAVTQIATIGNASVRQNIINVFGPKAMADVIEFDLCLVEGISAASMGAMVKAENENNEDEGELDSKGDIKLTGFISSPAFGKGRSSTDRQYFYINGRPCTLPKLARVINEVYRSFNTNQSPFLVANLILPTSYYDVNVSPDKRTIFLHNERMIIEELRTKLTELFEPSRSTFAVSQARQLIKEPDLAVRLRSKPSGDKGSIPNEALEVENDARENEGEYRLKHHSKALSIEPITPPSLPPSHLSVQGKLDFIDKTNNRQSTLTGRNFLVQRSENLKRKAEDLDPATDNEITRNGNDQMIRELVTKQGAMEESSSILGTNNIVENTTPHSNDSSRLSVHPASSINVLEEYDPLNDETRLDEESISDSEKEQELVPQQRPQKQRQRVVVIDSAVQQDDQREWIEIGFDIDEQKKKKAQRINIIRQVRRSEQEWKELRKDHAQKKQMESAHDDVEEVGEETHSAKLRRSRRLRNQKLSDASFANMDDAKAQTSLSRVIAKGDFARMKILGQFNKAFIVARLDNYAPAEEDQGNPKSSTIRGARQRHREELISSDIFVIDQHASDEKYNFETLQAKTIFSTQRLLQPKELYLTAQEEITVVEHMKMLNKNGFYLEHNPDAPVSHRLKLLTLPVSEKVVFGFQDFEELVFLLSQQTALPEAVEKNSNESIDQNEHRQSINIQQNNGSTSEKMVRCSKVRALFASRACRRSVMIGHVLNHSQMKRIVRHMGEIDQPWNCPHGRPTMRHLMDLAELGQQEQLERLRLDSMYKENRERNDDKEKNELWRGRGLSAFEPIALKRPTQHRGSLFRQFMAMPARVHSHENL